MLNVRFITRIIVYWRQLDEVTVVVSLSIASLLASLTRFDLTRGLRCFAARTIPIMYSE